MPHQCTACGRTFGDGSKEMLSGCPDCGGNKFQFKPPGTVDADSRPADSTGTPATSGSNGTETFDAEVERSTDVDVETPTDAEVERPTDAEKVSDAGETIDAEDRAQASARSDVVSPEELSSAAERTGGESGRGPPSAHDGPPSEAQEEATPPERPSLDSLREELNDQFESIRIVNPGQYELNLMELYDRQEYIISLKEDGRYVIEMPGDWGPDDE